MDKQTLSEAISNAKKYAKTLKVYSFQFSNKFQSAIHNNYPKILFQVSSAITNSLIYIPIQSLCTPFDIFSNKTKSKVESMTFLK
jgi:hypothetical protein